VGNEDSKFSFFLPLELRFLICSFPKELMYKEVETKNECFKDVDISLEDAFCSFFD
jgi:hypothetical protein